MVDFGSSRGMVTSGIYTGSNLQRKIYLYYQTSGMWVSQVSENVNCVTGIASQCVY